MKNRKKKGEHGYLDYEKKVTILRTILLFGLSLAVFLLGYFSTGKKENLLTVVAVLGCLPASRSAVNMIIVLRYHGISMENYKKIKKSVGECLSLYDLVFTSYEKNFEIHHMAFKGNILIGYTANASCDTKACEKHLHDMCAQNNLSDVDITIFKDMPKYLKRLESIQELPDYTVGEEENPVYKSQLVGSLLCAISL